MQNSNKHKICRRNLRRHASKAENLLWFILRNRYIGYKFRRQHSIPPYIVDFYCAEAKLVVEIDGITHEGEKSQQYDKKRELYLQSKGYAVVRYGVQHIYEDREAIAQDIAKHCNKLLSPQGRD